MSGQHAAFAALALFVAAAPAQAAQWFACSAWGGSHTGRYTFWIDSRSCAVHWKELGPDLAIDECAPPYIVARKPFAINDEYVLRFNTRTGAFSDSVSGATDFGQCRPIRGGGPGNPAGHPS
jgi:hypothetical protein